MNKEMVKGMAIGIILTIAVSLGYLAYNMNKRIIVIEQIIEQSIRASRMQPRQAMQMPKQPVKAVKAVKGKRK